MALILLLLAVWPLRNMGVANARSLWAPSARALQVRLCAVRGAAITDTAMIQAQAVIQTRVTSGFRVRDLAVVRVGARCVRVTLSGSPNVSRFRATLTQVGNLVLANSGHSYMQPGTRVRLVCRDAGCIGGAPAGRTDLGTYPPTVRVVVTGDDVLRGSAKVGHDQSGAATVTYALDPQGSQAWCRFTRGHIHQYAAIVLDGRVLSDPFIEAAICSGQSQITGLQSTTQARSITAFLNSGPLPFRFRVRALTTHP